ncbi:MAG TPA: helix-turn-helix domain-containing protein [Sphingobacteriaceae bacterium]
MPREIITTSYSEEEFKELLKSIITEAVKEEIDRILERPNRPIPPKEFLTRQETAKILGISLPTLHLRVKEGFIAPRRVGSRVLFKWEDLQSAMRTYDEKRLDKPGRNINARPAKRIW